MTTLEQLTGWIPGQWEKVIVTALLVGLALVASHLWGRYLSRGEMSAEKRRLHLVWARNIIWFAALLSLCRCGHPRLQALRCRWRQWRVPY